MRNVWQKWVFKVFKYLFIIIIIILNNIYAWCQPDILFDHFYWKHTTRGAALTLREQAGHCTSTLTDLYILPTHPWQHRTEAHIYGPWII